MSAAKGRFSRFCKVVAVAAALAAAFVVGCDDGENPENINGGTDLTLPWTQWKLEGIVDQRTGELRVLEPADCDICYTLMFDKRSHNTTGIDTTVGPLIPMTISGNSSTNEMFGNYTADYETKNIRITNFGGTKKGEIGDGYLWWDIVPTINSFFLQADKLMLYYGDNNEYYLLFKSLDI